MDHLAIMSKKRRLLEKILSGEKMIESRWYINRKLPFRTVKDGDIIYFKDSGEPVSACAVVKRALFFENLDERKIRWILSKYGSRILLDQSDAGRLIGKRFCTLIFLKNIKAIKPFTVDKKGYGTMSAWITVHSINEIRTVD